MAKRKRKYEPWHPRLLKRMADNSRRQLGRYPREERRERAYGVSATTSSASEPDKGGEPVTCPKCEDALKAQNPYCRRCVRSAPLTLPAGSRPAASGSLPDSHRE